MSSVAHQPKLVEAKKREAKKAHREAKVEYAKFYESEADAERKLSAIVGLMSRNIKFD